MTGEAHWLDLLVVFGGGTLLMALLFLVTWQRYLHRRHVRVTCPKVNEDRDTTMVLDSRTGWYLTVVRCSAFADPSSVTCEQDCRRILNERAHADAAHATR